MAFVECMELLDAFGKAEEYVREHHPEEVEWSLAMVRKDPTDTKPTEFIREYVWSIYTSGFSAKIVRDKWPELEAAYMGFDRHKIVEYAWKVRENALKIINNRAKTDKILEGISFIHTFTPLEWFKFMLKVEKDVKELRVLRGIGPTLIHHLARNIGINTVKPDVHLSRMARYFRMDPFKMCDKISGMTGLPVHLVDTIIWRASVERVLDYRVLGSSSSYERRALGLSYPRT